MHLLQPKLSAHHDKTTAADPQLCTWVQNWRTEKRSDDEDEGRIYKKLNPINNSFYSSWHFSYFRKPPNHSQGKRARVNSAELPDEVGFDIIQTSKNTKNL